MQRNENEGPPERRQDRPRRAGAEARYVRQPRNLDAGVCSLPLTGKGVLDRITNLGVLDVVPGALKLVELADGVTEAEVRAATEATLV